MLVEMKLPLYLDRSNWCGSPGCREAHDTWTIRDQEGLAVVELSAQSREESRQIQQLFRRLTACVNGCDGVPTEALEVMARTRVLGNLWDQEWEPAFNGETAP